MADSWLTSGSLRRIIQTFVSEMECVRANRECDGRVCPFGRPPQRVAVRSLHFWFRRAVVECAFLVQTCVVECQSCRSFVLIPSRKLLILIPSRKLLVMIWMTKLLVMVRKCQVVTVRRRATRFRPREACTARTTDEVPPARASDRLFPMRANEPALPTRS